MLELLRRNPLRTAAACIPLVLLMAAGTGCSRGHYRVQADQDARYLVLQKAQDPRWELPDFSIEIDPRSRYYSPYDPDYPPMPPDDPSAHRFMRRVNGMKGFSHWYDHGCIRDLENPRWESYLSQYAEITEKGAVKLTADDSVRLALMHSPDYQEELETLYLSALDVSTERFRFDVQFFGGNSTTFETLGTERAGGPSSALQTDTNFSLNKRLATAGQIMVGFVNSTVFEFFGPDTSVTTSVLNFSLIQPLLRGGGRAVALEQLTIAERGLLANIRAFQRYREGFYTAVVVGDTSVQGPQRRGGFFGGTGLTGFTGQGSGGFGGVGEATGFGRGGFGAEGGGAGAVTTGFVGGGAGQVGGFIGLLQQMQQIRNTDESLSAELRTLALLEANLEAGLIDIAQVDQFRQSIETERAVQLQARNDLETSLDTFKSRTLGLPPDLPIELDDTLIRPFQLITPALSQTQNSAAEFIERFGGLPRDPEMERLREEFGGMRELIQETDARFALVEEDLRQLNIALPNRTKEMDESNRVRFTQDMLGLQESLRTLRTRFELIEPRLERLDDALTPETRAQTANAAVAVLTDLLNAAGELSLIQARARLETISVDPIELESQDALNIARANRFDWMNNRAALVDSWRLIEFNANALKSRLDIEFSGDLQTRGAFVDGDNPFAFRDETGRLTASLEFDAPFTRLVERNNFRQQLISYQQARRQLIQFEDGVHRSLRLNLRVLNQLETNLDIQRRAVAIAIRRVEQTREVLNRPAPPVVPGQPVTQFGPTSALNLLTALSDLRSSQNNLMSVWLNHYAARMTLMRDLGVMRLDEYGLWIDEPIDQATQLAAGECPLPPAVPARFWNLVPEMRPQEATPLPEDSVPMPDPVPESAPEPAASAREKSAQSSRVASGPELGPVLKLDEAIPTNVNSAPSNGRPPQTRIRDAAQSSPLPTRRTAARMPAEIGTPFDR